jgi:predicted Rdx family selenoprotein
MAHNWVNGYCVHCDWLLGEGYTQEEIHEMIKKAQKK